MQGALVWSLVHQPRQHIKKQRHYFVNKCPPSPGYCFFSHHVWMWDLEYKESWAQKNWCFWTVVLEKTLERPLGCKEIQPVHPKGDWSWVFTGRTDVEAETPVLWPPDVKNWLIRKDPDAGKDWGQEKGMTEDEMVGWHHRLDGHGFDWTPGGGDGQGGLECCDSWGRKVGYDWATEQLIRKEIHRVSRCSRKRWGYPGGLDNKIRNKISRHPIFKIRFDRGLPEGLLRF